MVSNMHTKAKITNGLIDEFGNSTVDIEFEGCYGWMYGSTKDITEREINMFKQGVLAERERVWYRLINILDKDTLGNISYSDLFPN